jgi:uncharacterized tellurite resistance protein B-like protein
MLNRFRKLLTTSREDQLQPDRVQVATCALLLEMAHSDQRYDAAEESLVLDHLRRHFALPPADLEALLRSAREAHLESADLFQFAREINAACSLEEKLAIMETLWRIVYADGVLDKFEDALARQLATLLRISHRQAIELKLKALADLRGAD